VEEEEEEAFEAAEAEVEVGVEDFVAEEEEWEATSMKSQAVWSKLENLSMHEKIT